MTKFILNWYLNSLAYHTPARLLLELLVCFQIDVFVFPCFGLRGKFLFCVLDKFTIYIRICSSNIMYVCNNIEYKISIYNYMYVWVRPIASVSASNSCVCASQSLKQLTKKPESPTTKLKRNENYLLNFCHLRMTALSLVAMPLCQTIEQLLEEKKKHTNIRQTMKACNHIFGSINLAINFSKISSYTEIVLRSQLFGTGTSRIRSWLSIYSLLTTVCARVYVCVCVSYVVCRMSLN